MKHEKSAGAVVFREVRSKNKELSLEREYLLLSYPSIDKNGERKGKIIWGFPKGMVGEGESERETALREIREETGLSDISLIDGFRVEEKYFFKKEKELVDKVVAYFLAQSTGGQVKVSFEHLGFEWLNFEEALKRLSFKNSREILEKAEKFLNGKEVSAQPRLI